MTRPRTTLIAVALMLPVLLGLTYLGRTTVVFLLVGSDGSVNESIRYSYDNGFLNDSRTIGFMCGAGSGSCQRLCGVCHTNGEDRSKQVFTDEKHEKTYFPRSAVLYTSGQRLWSDLTGGYLTAGADGQLKYLRKDGTVELIAPSGSMVLKDGSGQTLGLFMPSVPTLRPR